MHARKNDGSKILLKMRLLRPKNFKMKNLETWNYLKKEIGGIIYKIGLRKIIWKIGFGKTIFKIKNEENEDDMWPNEAMQTI